MCHHESASVEAASKLWQEKVRIIGVAWNGSAQDMQRFISETGITFSNINDEKGLIYAKFGIPRQPAWVFIGQSGETTINNNALSEIELNAMLETLVASSGA